MEVRELNAPRRSAAAGSYATPPERRYIVRHMRMRFLRWLGFWVWTVCLLSLLLAANLFVVRLALDDQKIWMVGLFAVAVLALDVLYARYFGPPLRRMLRVRPWLRVPRTVDVLESQGSLRWRALHRDDATPCIFVGDHPVDLPDHWFSPAADLGETGFRLAVLPGATGEAIRIVMRSTPMPHGPFARRRIDAVFRDPAHLVIAMGPHAIDDEVRAGVPAIRAAMVWTDLILLLAVAAVLAWSWQGNRARDLEMIHAGHAAATARVDARIGDVEAIDVEALRARGLENVVAMTGQAGRIVTVDAFDAVLVGWTRDAEPALIHENELQAIRAVAQVLPTTLYRDQPPPAAIDAYRQRLRKRLDALADVPTDLRARVDTVPDAVVGAQMLALAGPRPDPEFLEALAPSPRLTLPPPEDALVAQPVAQCRQDGICRHRVPAGVLDRPALLQRGGVLEVHDARTLAPVPFAPPRALEREVERWRILAMSLTGLPVAILLLWLPAWWRVRRHLRRVAA